jgi:hypothetical protein
MGKFPSVRGRYTLGGRAMGRGKVSKQEKVIEKDLKSYLA